MRADKLLPRGGGLALGRWCDAMALQDIAHGLVTDGVPEVGEGSDDPIIAPGTIFLRHADDQCLQLLVNRGTPRGLARVWSRQTSGPRAAGASQESCRA